MLKSNLDKVYKITKKRKNKRKTKQLLNILKFVKSRLDAFGFKSQHVVLQEQAGDDKSKNPASNQGNTTSTKASPNFISSDPINEEDKKQQ